MPVPKFWNQMINYDIESLKFFVHQVFKFTIAKIIGIRIIIINQVYLNCL